MLAAPSRVFQAGVEVRVGALGAHSGIWEAEGSVLLLHPPLHLVCLTPSMSEAHIARTWLGRGGRDQTLPAISVCLS